MNKLLLMEPPVTNYAPVLLVGWDACAHMPAEIKGFAGRGIWLILRCGKRQIAIEEEWERDARFEPSTGRGILPAGFEPSQISEFNPDNLQGATVMKFMRVIGSSDVSLSHHPAPLRRLDGRALPFFLLPSHSPRGCASRSLQSFNYCGGEKKDCVQSTARQALGDTCCWCFSLDLATFS